MRILDNFFKVTIILIISILSLVLNVDASTNNPLKEQKIEQPFVALVEMKMAILPGSASYFEKSLKKATAEGAKIMILKLDTPGGVLNSAQNIIQNIFDSEIPVIVFITPDGASATSAGVFITLASDVAVMSKGTSIGAAHPVMSTGQDIKGDMRKKAENMAIAMIKSIAESRNKNAKWAENSVKESVSITATKAVQENVVDFIANDRLELFKKLKGRVIKFKGNNLTFEDYTKLPIKEYKMSLQDKMLNVLSDPSIAVLLWLGAVVGLALELYHPGAIFPGLLGVVCLILAMIVNQVLPVSVGALILIIAGFIMIGVEMVVTSGLFGIFGVISVVIGSLSLVDLSNFPEFAINPWIILPSAIACIVFFVLVTLLVVKVMGKKSKVGLDSLIGVVGNATSNFEGEENKGTIFLDGTYWTAVSSEDIKKGDNVMVVSNKRSLILEVVKVKKD